MVGVQGMPDGGEDAFHMRAALRPEISTCQATSGREQQPRRLPAGSVTGAGAGSHCRRVMTGSTAAKLGDSQGTRGSHTSPSAQAGASQPQLKTRKPLAGVVEKHRPHLLQKARELHKLWPQEFGGLQGRSAGARRAVFRLLRDDAKQRSQRQVPAAGSRPHPGAGQEASSPPAQPHHSPARGREGGPARALTRAPLFGAAAALWK